MEEYQDIIGQWNIWFKRKLGTWFVVGRLLIGLIREQIGGRRSIKLIALIKSWPRCHSKVKVMVLYVMSTLYLYSKHRDRVIHLTLVSVRRRYRNYGIGKYLLSVSVKSVFPPPTPYFVMNYFLSVTYPDLYNVHLSWKVIH